MSELLEKEANFEELLNQSFKTLNTGDFVHGVVTTVTPAEVHVDIGAKVTGIITIENVTNDPGAKLEQIFKVGDEVDAIAVRVSDIDGTATLSTKKISNEKDWLSVVEAEAEHTTLEGKVTEVIKGGVLILYKNQKIFIPASQSNLPSDGDLNSLFGTTQLFKVIEIKSDRRRAVGSIRSAVREERKLKVEKFWSEIEVGKQYRGVVTNLADFGAFVDLGGVDGMVHNTELSWLHINNPKEVVQVGDEIDVFVKAFDPETKKISLGHKLESENPWVLFTSNNEVGDVISVKIVGLTDFGIFAEIIPGVDGLIHISQTGLDKATELTEVYKKGDVIEVKITKINEERHKVSLSIKAALEVPAEEAEETEAVEATEAPADAE